MPPFGHATELRILIGIDPHRLVEASGGVVTDLTRSWRPGALTDRVGVYRPLGEVRDAEVDV